jgi:hypothetical protein
MPIVFLDELPTDLVDALRAAEGVRITLGDRMSIDISDSMAAKQLYKAFLTDTEAFVDPVVIPMFGHPLAQFVPLNVQAEVWNLLATFEPLLAASFVPGAALPAFVNLQVLPVGGIEYHHSKIAIQAVQDEIVSLPRFAAACPALALVPSGSVICDLLIQYARCNIIQCLRKF